MDVYSSAKPAIFVLPPEILATIFIYVAHAFNPFSYQWMASVCHICQAWRAVALSVAALWSEVSFMDLRKVKELSTCFRATPLSVEAPFFEWQCRARRRTVFYIPPLVQEELERRMKSLISFTAQYAPQIRTYNVDMMREDVNDATLSQFFQLFSRPFPVLETLRIMLCRPTTFCMLPANALGRSSPSLRNLHLHGCAVHWNARWMFTELRSLYLMHGPPGFSLSLSMLLDCLNQIPHLNLLHLHIHLKDDRSSLTSIPTIIMLHLQSLYLSTDMPIAACLFQHINPNTPIKHVFGICDNANHPGDEPSFLMLVPAIVQRPGNDVNFVRLGRFLLEAWSDETLSPWDIDTLPSITIHIASLNYTSVPYINILRALLHPHLFSHLRSLEVNSLPSDLGQSLGQILGQIEFPALTHIRIVRCQTTLQRLVSDNFGGEYLRNLERVEFHEWNWRASIHPHAIDAFLLVHNLLQFRQAQGYQLPSLHLASCEGLTEAQCNKLSEVVGQVTWVRSCYEESCGELRRTGRP